MKHEPIVMLLFQGAVMMERATYYDPRNWLDQHRDMSLDIDNMSYEVINTSVNLMHMLL